VVRQRPRKQLSQINVVPYIDVMLVLLVIFMVTAPFLSPGQVELPRVSKSSAPPAQPLEVIVRADASLALRESAGKEPRALSKKALPAAVLEAMSDNPERPVVIAGDKSVRYEAVIEVMDMLRAQGVKKIGLLARTGEQ
jgi:biopolymer transport protein TolR